MRHPTLLARFDFGNEELIEIAPPPAGSNPQRHFRGRRDPSDKLTDRETSTPAPLKSKGCGTLPYLRSSISATGDSSKSLCRPPRQNHQANNVNPRTLKNEGCGTLPYLRASISVTRNSSKSHCHPPVEQLAVLLHRGAWPDPDRRRGSVTASEAENTHPQKPRVGHPPRRKNPRPQKPRTGHPRKKAKTHV